ncbi:MAG TPA: hypothetical protein VMI12_08050 [Puia sp.]|nr:hypothetical protein [Puia sp.]
MFTKTDIEKYFIAEKTGSMIFLIIGIIAILLSLIFYFLLKTNFYKGAAIPLLIVGVIQAIAGYTVYARSDEQRISNVYAYDMNPDRLKTEELPRIKEVNKRFVLYRWIEIALIITGIALILVYKTSIPKNFWFGLGITLLIQAIVILFADYFAEQRAKIYQQQLESFFTSKKTI